jgi:hypothetical protein
VTEDLMVEASPENGGSSAEQLDGRLRLRWTKALDGNRSKLKYLSRPYSYDSRTVWKGIGGVPLHPAPDRYYRQQGHIQKN